MMTAAFARRTLARPRPRSRVARAPEGFLGSRGRDARLRRATATWLRRGARGGPEEDLPNEFTERAWEAIVLAPEIASNAQQQIVETEHLCKALFEQNDSFALRIFTEAGADPSAAVGFIDRFIARQPR